MWSWVANHIGWILGALGGIGAGIPVVLIIAFGIPAATIITSVVGFLKSAVDFLKTPAGQAFAVVGLCLLSALGGNILGHRSESAACEARVEGLVQASKEAKEQLEQKLADLTQKLREAQDEAERQADEHNEKIEDDLKSSCHLSGDDVKRLRDLR
jgi:hypothetical protein